MTNQERQQLEALIEQLEDIQSTAPAIAQYRQGKVNGSVAHRLLDVISELKAIAHGTKQTTE